MLQESNYVPPPEKDFVTSPPEPTTTTASRLKERGEKGVVLNGALTIELLAIIVVAGFIGIIVLVGVIYKCLRHAGSLLNLAGFFEEMRDWSQLFPSASQS